MWQLETDRGDHMRARFVICANGTLSKPKLAKIAGMESFAGHCFHTSRWDYDYTGPDLSRLGDKDVGIIGTGASAVQAIPKLAAAARALTVFQRTPSSVDLKNDWPTDPSGRKAAAQVAGQTSRARARRRARPGALRRSARKIRRQNANIDYMMRIHRHRVVVGPRQPRRSALVHVYV
jgi:cation diffusion facilitator CzcD-associated flavoprotein CzcO